MAGVDLDQPCARNRSRERLRVGGREDPAALCAEQSTDPVVLDTVSEIEVLTTGMSRKIWQKISLLHLAQQGPSAAPLT